MCGIVAVVGGPISSGVLLSAVDILTHRGPDAWGVWSSPKGLCHFGHRRLSIIDLSVDGAQPMISPDSKYALVFNGEIYNYRELKGELGREWGFRSRSDTEVLLASYARWGRDCLQKLIGMFAFIMWDEDNHELIAVRDRFGVKPLYYADLPDGHTAIASEIKVLHRLGLERQPEVAAWANYLRYGQYDCGELTFWNGVRAVPPGHILRWRNGKVEVEKWYNPAAEIGELLDTRSEDEVVEEYRQLVRESVSLRFRADVPVGICLSGGLDSAALFWQVHEVQGPDSEVSAFTFVTGDSNYDQLHNVHSMLDGTRHPHLLTLLQPFEVPDLALRIQAYQDEPFGGLPTLAYSKLFGLAREHGITVLLDGQGLDEQWAGYDYYQDVAYRDEEGMMVEESPHLQGSHSTPVRAECLDMEFSRRANPVIVPKPFPDKLRNLQYRDAFYTKIPRALRFNDRISMMHSTELREPFLDHRLFQLAFRQPVDRKIRNGEGKSLLRRMLNHNLPNSLVRSPKLALQTPQREWLRKELRSWVEDTLNNTSMWQLGWFNRTLVLRELEKYFAEGSDNSFFLWQWINLSLWIEVCWKNVEPK